jgi:GT2 family glycosyltransferase
MEMSSVSVIICTCNRDDSLCDAVSSVLQQDYEGGLELIVVDQSNGLTQRATDFIRSLEGRLRLIQQVQPNLPKGRNAGIAVARGELLLFIDDDIILPSHGIRRLAEHFRVSRTKAVTGLVVSENRPEESLRAYARQFGVTSMDADSGAIEVQGFFGALMMVSAKVVRAAGGFDPRLGMLTPTAYGEDDDFCCRLRRADVPLLIDPSVRVVHRDHLEGGCGSRQTDPLLALKYHIKSMAYIRIKHHGRLGAGGWLQLARAYLVNRGILQRGPREVLRNFRTIRTALQEVKTFMACNGAGGPAPGAFPARPLKVNSLHRQEP